MSEETENRRFILRTDAIRDHAIAYLRMLVVNDKKPYEVTVKFYKCKRSLAQNALFHKWMTEVSKQHYANTGNLVSPKVWKAYFKLHFLGEEPLECNGRKWVEIRHTSDLGVKEMSEFMNNVDHYCGAELNIILPHPMDFWYEAMGRAA